MKPRTYSEIAAHGVEDHYESATRLLYSVRKSTPISISNFSTDVTLYKPGFTNFLASQTIEHVLPRTLGNILSTNDLNNMFPSSKLYNSLRGNSDFTIRVYQDDIFCSVPKPLTPDEVETVNQRIRMNNSVYGSDVVRDQPHNILKVLAEKRSRVSIYTNAFHTWPALQQRLESLRYSYIDDIHDRAAFARKWLYARAMYTVMGNQAIDDTRGKTGKSTSRITISPRQYFELNEMIDLAFDPQYAPSVIERQIDMQIASLYNGWHNPLINPPIDKLIMEPYFEKRGTRTNDCRFRGNNGYDASNFDPLKQLLTELILVGYTGSYDL